MSDKIKETVSFIRKKVDLSPKYGIILGTGLGGLVKEIKVDHVLDYERIPHFAVSTVEGHHGKLIFGHIGNKRLVAMQGRFHFYEGYSMEQVIFPVRVMNALGITHLFVSNASGGLNPDFEIGDLMIITDHINLLPNPLIGQHNDEFGPRFPDMSDAYDTKMIKKANEIANRLHIPIRKGVYVALTGPTLETPAEYNYLRIIGGDTVGMSTIPEIIAARQMNIKCFAVSIITDLGVPGKIKKVTLEDVLEVAGRSEPKMTMIMKELILSV